MLKDNAYIFPGLGVVACRIRRVMAAMFLAAADTLSAATNSAELEQGPVYPAISLMRDASAQVAESVALSGYREGLALLPPPDNLGAHIQYPLYQLAYPAVPSRVTASQPASR
ncbi:MAG TPA: malic enzyme-like NAD(P)-binding protein [Gemmatimonadales bacterium]|nr:malic enzyme-like NAD(P)-binding protein [Gemmatimonadales bacterium]